MRTIPIAKLLIVFAITFSLVSLAGPLAGNLRLPTVPLGHALPLNCQTHGSTGACSEFWYPAGPSMDTELASIFANGPAEYTNLQSATPSIDFTDWPAGPSIGPAICASTSLTCTQSEITVGYFEIQFMQANNFWGCNFNYGNAACGIQMRQAIAHMVDKTIFASSSPNCSGVCTPIDNPTPTSIGGSLPAANPCGWDANFTQTGCTAPYPGGTAYHLAAATGGNGLAWLQAPGSLDLNAACSHLANAFGTGATCNSASRLTLTSTQQSNALAHVPTFFIRSDDLARKDLGTAYAEQICYIFTGSYSTPCSYLNTIPGPITAFPGFQTSPTSVNLSWWIYTAGYIGGTFFDSSLYFTYNSHFVSGIPSIQGPPVGSGTCDPTSVPSSSAADYMYLCSPSYDAISAKMEHDATLAAAQTDGISTENVYGQGAYTIPGYETSDQYGVCMPGPSSGCGTWSNVVNNSSTGLANFFTWLNAWNPTPAQSGTIRQAFAEGAGSVNPYIASTVWDFYLAGNVWDSLYAANPLNGTQLMNWMTVSTVSEPNSGLTYAPPGGTCTTPGLSCTVSTFRFTLNPTLFFQNGQKITAFDVAFSYLSLLGTGAFQSSGASPVIGITVLNSNQFDFNLNSLGPFTLASITGLTILPGALWTNDPSGWSTGIGTCTAQGAACYPAQYTLTGGVTPACALTCVFASTSMKWDPTKIVPAYDPLSRGTFIGSSAWQCGSGSGVGGPCSSNGKTPGASSFTLSRFGTGVAPASSLSGSYFRSSGNLALWFWSEDTGDLTHDFLNFSVVAACVTAPLVPLGTVSGCGHFQQGIGTNGATTPGGTIGTNLSVDSKIKFVDTPPASTPNAPGTWASGKTVIYDSDNSGTVTSGDIVISGPTPAIGTNLSVDSKLKFVGQPPASTPNAPGTFTPGTPSSTVIYDSDSSGTYTSGDIVASGFAPAGGCPAGTTCGIPVGLTQVSIVQRFVGLNWIAPFDWHVTAGPSAITGIGALASTLYEGLAPSIRPAGYPAFTPGQQQTLNPASVAGCTSAYPTGGYDC